MGNVKLIIEVPEWYYEETKEFKHPTLIDKALINGTPFDSVINDIKAEIETLQSDTNVMMYSLAISDVLEIIDKHIGKETDEL